MAEDLAQDCVSGKELGNFRPADGTGIHGDRTTNCEGSKRGPDEGRSKIKGRREGSPDAAGDGRDGSHEEGIVGYEEPIQSDAE